MTDLDDVEFGDSKIETPEERPRIRVSVASYDCFSQLWLSVLLRAVEDASMTLREPRQHKHNASCKRHCAKTLLTEDHKAQLSARTWFVAGADDVGSLRWICDMLDLDPEVIKRELRKRIEANAEDKRLGRTGANRTYPRAVLHHHTGDRGTRNRESPDDYGRA